MNSNLIYDIGMHNGDDTAYYLSLGYEVIAVEASPDLVKLGYERFKKDIINKKLEILNVGIASTDGYLDFYLNKINSVWNSFDKEIGTREGAETEIIQVRTQRSDQLISEKGTPYYMKIDIEGQDIICLDSLKNLYEKPIFISAEVNDVSVIDKLKELGYNNFKIIHQPSLLPLELPVSKEYKLYCSHTEFRNSLNPFMRVVRRLFGRFINHMYERKYNLLFDYEHPYGSSGTFGNYLPGKWVNYGEILEVYEYYKLAHEKSGTNTGYNYWIDVHATRT
jgi:FkbM family methyltransferase